MNSHTPHNKNLTDLYLKAPVPSPTEKSALADCENKDSAIQLEHSDREENVTKDFRRCVSCRKIALRGEFWRVVKCHPSDRVEIDLGETFRQGRSVYLCPTTECLQLAQKKNRLGKSLKVQVPQSIYQALGSRLP